MSNRTPSAQPDREDIYGQFIIRKFETIGQKNIYQWSIGQRSYTDFRLFSKRHQDANETMLLMEADESLVKNGIKIDNELLFKIFKSELQKLKDEFLPE